jgi:hypothetical protein
MAPFSWPVQAIAWLPEAVRPGIFVALVVLLVWVVARGHAGGVWRASCRGAARLLDLAVGAVLRVEYAITSMRRRGGDAPPRWAFALAYMTDGIEDGAAWLYARNLPPVPEPVGGEQDDGDQEDAEPAARPAEAPRRPSRERSYLALACVVIVVGFTAAWIAMDRIAPTSIVKYRLAQGFGPWRDIEDWAGADSGRGGEPVLVHARRRHTLLRARVACRGSVRCSGWVVLKRRSGPVVAVRAIELHPGSTVVALRLTRQQAREGRGGRVVVEQV